MLDKANIGNEFIGNIRSDGNEEFMRQLYARMPRDNEFMTPAYV